MFEKETIDLHNRMQERILSSKGEWEHSPIESWKKDYWQNNFKESDLMNFRRTPLADGMISFPDRPLKYERVILKPWISGIPTFQKIRGMRDVLLEIYRLRSKFNIRLSDINDNRVGNPCYYRIGTSCVTDFSLRMCFYQKYVEENLKLEGIVNVLEVGGGFGGICLRLINSRKIDINNYYLVDLPEILVLAYWYLRNSGCSVDAIITEEDMDILKKEQEGKKVFLVAPWILPQIREKIDFFINTMSFQHMTEENLKYYFSQIDRLGVKKLFLVNGEKRKFPEVDFDKYPIPDRYKLMKQDNYIFSNHLIKIYVC